MIEAIPLVAWMACGSDSTLLSSIVLPALVELLNVEMLSPGPIKAERRAAQPTPGCICAAQHLYGESTWRAWIHEIGIMRGMPGLGHATCCLRHRPPPTAHLQPTRFCRPRC